MSMFSWAFKSNTELGQAEFPEIFPLTLKQDDFTKSDILATYLKILTDAMERTHGVAKKDEPLLWDNCIQSETNQGLISLLANAMATQCELFLVKKAGVLREATPDEKEQIKKDYKEKAESKNGVYVSFKKYQRTEMLLIYSRLEYCVLASLNKTLNLAKATQLKIHDLRQSTSLADSGVAKEQAKSIANALRKGSDVLLDKLDQIETATPDTSPTEKAIGFLDSKRAFILGMPISYLGGEQTAGIGSTGEADMRAVERGLKQYYVSVLRPTLKAIFGANTEFKSQDFREMNTALEALKAFDLASDENLSQKSKQEILARLFDVDPKEEQKNLADEEEDRAKEETANPPKPNARPVFGNPNAAAVN